jgi:CRP/FNR family cyclic AMP-dependent transcriptional regulator
MSIGETRFDPLVFLSKVGPRTKTVECRRNQIVFAQGDAANAVFFIRKGKIKLTVTSKNGKEAVIGLLGTGSFFG